MDATVIKKIKKFKADGKTDKETVEALARSGVQSPRGKPYSLSAVRGALHKGKKTKRTRHQEAKDCQECDEIALSVEMVMSALAATGSVTRTRTAFQNALSMLS